MVTAGTHVLCQCFVPVQRTSVRVTVDFARAGALNIFTSGACTRSTGTVFNEASLVLFALEIRRQQRQ